MWHFMSGLVRSAKHLLGSSMYTEILSSLITTSICLFTCWWVENIPASSCYEECGCKCSQEILLWMCMSGSLGQIPRRGKGARSRISGFRILRSIWTVYNTLCFVFVSRLIFPTPWSPPCGHSNRGPGFHVWASHSSLASPPLLNTSAFPVLWSSLLCFCQRQWLRQRQ